MPKKEEHAVDTLLLVGNSRLPENNASFGAYRVIGLVLEVREETGEIVAAESAAVTSLGRDFVRRLLVGRNINDLDELTGLFQTQYLGNAKKPLINSLIMCHKRYIYHKSNNGESEAFDKDF
jgi:hypothetical protein